MVVDWNDFYQSFKNKFGIEPNPKFKDIVELVNSATKPAYKPYHIENLEQPYSGYLWVEPKYDGSHIVFSNHGIFTHSGLPLDKGMLMLLGYYYNQHPDIVEYLIKKSDDLGFSCELYGQLNSPAGFHKSPNNPLIDLVIFEIYDVSEGRFLDPIFKYKFFEEVSITIKLPFANGRYLTYEQAKEWAMSPETYEGVVIKGGFYEDTAIKSVNGYEKYMRYNLFVAKIKKPKVQLKKESPEFTEAMANEIINEFDKHPEYLNMKPSEVQKAILDYMAKAHPELFMKMSRGKAKDFIYEEWKKRKGITQQ